jgi:hypothetical protein
MPLGGPLTSCLLWVEVSHQGLSHSAVLGTQASRMQRGSWHNPHLEARCTNCDGSADNAIPVSFADFGPSGFHLIRLRMRWANNCCLRVTEDWPRASSRGLKLQLTTAQVSSRLEIDGSSPVGIAEDILHQLLRSSIYPCNVRL